MRAMTCFGSLRQLQASMLKCSPNLAADRWIGEIGLVQATEKDHDMRISTRLILTLTLALPVAGSALAQTSEEDHKAHHPQASSVPGPATETASKPIGMEGMHEMHRKHEVQMKKIHGTKDPAKRQKLMDRHMKVAHEQMHSNDAMGAKPMGGAASK